MKFQLKGIKLDVDVKDGQAAVLKVTSGRAYGHVAQTGKYHHITPTNLVITSSLNDTLQLQFNSGSTWSCTMHFQPKDPGLQMSELLQCVTPKARNQDQIKVSVQDSSAKKQPSPQSDLLTIV